MFARLNSRLLAFPSDNPSRRRGGSTLVVITASSLILLALTIVGREIIPANEASAQTPGRLTTSGPAAANQFGATSHRIDLCRVVVIDDVEVPAREEGAITSIAVNEGDFVQKGAVLGAIDDRQAQLQHRAAQAELIAAQTRISDDIAVRYAQASFDAADAEYQQGLALNAARNKTLVSASEMRQRQLARYKTELEIDKARLDMKVGKMNVDVQNAALEIAAEQIQRRQIVSPIDGNVMWIYRGDENHRAAQVGQWVRAGEPVLRIIRMDRLYVEGLIDASQFSPGEMDGRPVTVHTELARGQQVQFTGKIMHLSPTVDKRNHYRIRAEVDNRRENNQWLLRPGATATMSVQLQ